MLFQGKQYLPYAAGNKIYGGGRDAPNIGPVDPMGHRTRDLKYQARRTAMLRRLKAMQTGNFGSADVGEAALMLDNNDYGGSGIGSILSNLGSQLNKPQPSAHRRSGSRYNASSRRSYGGGRSGYDRGSGGGYGRSSGGYSGGGGGGSSAPSIPSLSDYLGTDSVYQQAVRGGKRSLADFLSDIGRRRGEAGTQFNQTTANMERDRDLQLADMKDEFASRGLINSGLYGEEQGKFQTQFMTQLNALKQQQAALLADLLSQQTNYKRESDLALEAAKQEALARRAAQYNIGA